MNTHHEEEIEGVDQGLHPGEIGIRLDGKPGGHPGLTNRVRQRLRVFFTFDMDGEMIRTRLRERLDEITRVGDHHVNIEECVREVTPQRGTECGPHGQVRNEVTIHHVKMQQIGTLIQNRFAFHFESTEVRRENRWRDHRSITRR